MQPFIQVLIYRKMIRLLLHSQDIKTLKQDATGQAVALILEFTRGDVFGKKEALFVKFLSLLKKS